MKNNPIYTCYSVPLYKFLTENGIKYDVIGKSVTTGAIFYCYARTPELNRLLAEWSKNKPEKQGK